MRLDGVVMLAAPTARSRAYIQALVAADLLPGKVLLLGTESSQASSSPPQCWEGIHLPDHGESIAATCARAGVAVQPCEATTVNDEQVRAALLALTLIVSSNSVLAAPVCRAGISAYASVASVVNCIDRVSP